MPQDNVEIVRGLMQDHMTQTAPLYKALDALCGEAEQLRAGMNALTERVEAAEFDHTPLS